MTTIYDIAKRAGVSSATVSRVINEHRDVSEKTRQNVKSIMAELDFRPNATARGLATKSSQLIGVFFQDHLLTGLKHPFLQDVLSSFEVVAGEKGYDLLLFANYSAESTDNYEARARRRDVDGLLLFGISKTDPNVSTIIKSQIPCISIDMDLYGPRTGYLASDNVGGAILAIDHFVENGHRDIAFFADIYNSKPGLDRLIGYQQAMNKHGLPYPSEWTLHSDFSEQGGYEAAQRLLSLKKRPTALFCASDTMALGAMEALSMAALVVGQDISIIGFDDIAILKYLRPGLTTIRQNREEIGRRAAQALFDMIHCPQSHPPILTVPTELVIRESVACLIPSSKPVTEISPNY
ncbi:LacI family DNA-binding transcriptional regulator [Paenibacillus sp. S-38]|uniref:LacI family DNA-binding transcriptional regulator n=1 Tax=Paenibacillus sp. S-38 TaxID=3416710 RepID=UPI003CF33568